MRLGRFFSRWSRPAVVPTDAEITDELRAFVALVTEEKLAAGLSPEEARRQALIEVGGVEQIKEAVRDVHLGVTLDRLRQDVRYGLRLFRRAPVLNAAIVMALALGIGAAAATFSVVDAVLMRPLMYADADRLVAILHNQRNPVAPANFLDWQRESHAFAAMGAAEYWTPNFDSAEGPEKLFALHVSGEVLPMLGVRPALGRFVGADESATREIVIGDGLWRRAFGADPAILGRQMSLDGSPYAVVGVMPPDFTFAPFWATRAELWAPLVLGPRAASRGGNSLRVFARLAPGVTLEHARQSMAALAAELDRRYPGSNRHVTITPLKEMVVGNARRAILILFGAVALVLLVACANVAHLLLARAAAREKEVAVRAALGAGRGRLIHQFITESLLLATAGGAGGILLAAWTIDLFKRIGASSIPRAQSIALDTHVLLFATGVSVVTALLFGLAPAIRWSRPDLTTALHDHDRGATMGRRSRRTQQILIASEVALAVILLVGAALLIRSFAALRAVDPGWVPDRVVTMVVSVSGSVEAAPTRRAGFYTHVLDGLRTLPGVESAGAINHLPLVGDIWGLSFAVEGRPTPGPGEAPSAAYRLVLPGYFETMKLPIVRGRDVAETDREDAPDVVLVNQYLAQTHWPAEDALGKRIRIGSDVHSPWRTVVGITKNAVRGRWQERPEEEVYLPLLQDADFLHGGGPRDGSYLSYVIRTSGDPARIVPSARGVIRALAPAAAISDVFVMTDVVDQATMGARFILALLGAFAGVAWLLASVGIYGVMSYTVANRRREIGIRLALGATRGRIISRLVGEGLTVAATGAAAGAAGAALCSGAMSGLLFGVTPFDATAFFGAFVALMITAGMACYLPARRAARIEPQQELR